MGAELTLALGSSAWVMLEAFAPLGVEAVGAGMLALEALQKP